MNTHRLLWSLLGIWVFLCLVPSPCFGQQEPNSQLRPAYLGFSFGLSQSAFRDFATSPLRYSGRPLHLALSHTDVDARRQSSIHFSYSFGQYTNEYNRHEGSSRVRIIGFHYTELFALSALFNDRWNVKIGGQLRATANIRENGRLLNNRKGVEGIANLMAVLRAERGALAFQLNVGVINSSYRNGFAYLGQGAVLNNDDFFDGYQFRLFSGYRVSSELGYTLPLPNKNALRLAYLWEAYTTGERQAFELAQHQLALSFLFNLK